MTNNPLFGFWAYLMSDCVLFAGLFAVYAALVGATAGGPAGGDLFALPTVLAQTLLLLTSSLTCGLALVAAQRHKKSAALLWLGTTLILGLAFLYFEINEFSHLVASGAGPNTSAFLSAFFTLVGTHGLHITLGAVWMVVCMAYLALRGTGEATVRKLQCLALFWAFLDIVWIFIFTFVYLFGILAL